MFSIKEKGVHKYISFALELSTGNHYDEPHDVAPFNTLRVAFMHHFWYIKVPEIIKPRSRWVDLSQYDWATERDGKKGYTEHISKSYGFGTFEGSVHFHYGIQPGSWSKSDPKNSDHTKVWNVPFLNKRFIRTSYYDVMTHAHLKTFRDRKRGGFASFDEELKFRDSIPKLKVIFNDFDGEEISAELHIEEREWRHGLGMFKWLGWIIKPTIERSLAINFDKETGYEKGSWKGGTIGHSIEMRKNEIAEDAFMRYAYGSGRYRNHGNKPRNFSNVRFDYGI